MTDQKQQYLIETKHKKSVCEEQTWTNTLKSGKKVEVKVGNLYRWGHFHITINEKEKADLLKKENVLINDYEDYELISMWDGGCDFWVDIVDEDKYSEEELNEINILLYKSNEEENDDDDELYDEEKMFDNGWDETECKYTLNAPFALSLVEDE